MTSSITNREARGKGLSNIQRRCFKKSPRGIENRKIKPKIVTHHANLENPKRCFV